jgi:ribosomal protein S18 acetylase RimI-like enzyme
MKVRAAREDETPAIAELIDRHAREVFGESDMSEDEIRHWFSLPNVWILVAERNGELCGYVDRLTGPDGDGNELYACTLDEEAAHALLTAGYSLNSWHFSGDPQLGRVGSLGVMPAYRRRGLGEALLRHSFRDFRRRGATRVALGVDSQNETGAVRLYERVGMHLHRRNTTYEETL